MIQAQLSEALGCEPPSVTLMTRKLEAAGHIRRTPDPSDKRASIVELTDSGTAWPTGSSSCGARWRRKP